MKKLIAIPILLGLIFMTSFLPALNLFFTDAEGYIDRNIVCKWVDVDAPDAYMLEAVMEGDPVCRGAFSGRPYYPYEAASRSASLSRSLTKSFMPPSKRLTQ